MAPSSLLTSPELIEEEEGKKTPSPPSKVALKILGPEGEEGDEEEGREGKR